MTLFRLFLVALIAVIVPYTVIVVANYGLDIMPIFFGDIAAMGWPGQFNLDFLSFLMLGSVWLMWRHRFSVIGIVFGLFIFAGGMPFLATYLLVQSFRTKGDVGTLLLGESRVA